MAEELTLKKAPDWTQWVTNFDATYKMFYDNYDALVKLLPWVARNHPQLLGKHYKLLDEFKKQKPIIEQLRQTRDTVVNWLEIAGATIQSALNFTGVQAGIDWLKERFGLSGDGLGIAPVVIIGFAAAAAALSAIALLVKDAFEYSQQLNALQKSTDSFIAKGYTPQEAVTLSNQLFGKPKSPGESKLFGIDVNMLALTAAAILIAPPVIKMISERQK